MSKRLLLLCEHFHQEDLSAIAHFIDRQDKQKPNTTINVGLLTFNAIDENGDRC